jgi:hypothetical protein
MNDTSATPGGVRLAPRAIVCSKHPNEKNYSPALTGYSLTTDPLFLTQGIVEWSLGNDCFLWYWTLSI